MDYANLSGILRSLIYLKRPVGIIQRLKVVKISAVPKINSLDKRLFLSSIYHGFSKLELPERGMEKGI